MRCFVSPLPTKSSQAKIIVEASKNAPLRGQLSSELYGEIERLFSIDLSQVVFVRNSAKATQLKARAVTVGQEIHFAPNEWNEENESFITLLAHELAHIYQNKQNRVGATNMLGNQPINDDPRMEAEADQAAEATKKGRRFNFGKFKSGDNNLMKQFAQRKVAQRKALKTNWGEFKAEQYEELADARQKVSHIHFKLNFKPYKNVDSPKIGFVQTVKIVEGANKIAPNISTNERMAADGTRIDRKIGNNNPVYGTSVLDENGLDIENSTRIGDSEQDKNDKIEPTTTFGNTTTNPPQDAIMEDTPVVIFNDGRETNFETTVVSLEGEQKNTYYGSVTWGWKIKNGAAILDPLGVGSKESISDKFKPAINKWNSSNSSIEEKAGSEVRFKKSPTDVYELDPATNTPKSMATVVTFDEYGFFDEPFKPTPRIQIFGTDIFCNINGSVQVCTVLKIDNKRYAVLPIHVELVKPSDKPVAQLETANGINSTPDEAQMDTTKEYTTKESLVDVLHINSQENANLSITQGARVKISRDATTKAFLITVVEDENNPNLKDKTFILDLRGRNLSEIINLNN